MTIYSLCNILLIRKVMYYIVITMKKRIKMIGMIVLLLFIVFAGIFLKEKNEIDRLKNVQVMHVKDGCSIGEAKTLLIKAKVEVTILNEKITSIQLLEHDHGLGQNAETIIEEMMKENTWDVDTISGATLSSEVIKHAVNQALQKGAK